MLIILQMVTERSFALFYHLKYEIEEIFLHVYLYLYNFCLTWYEKVWMKLTDSWALAENLTWLAKKCKYF